MIDCCTVMQVVVFVVTQRRFPMVQAVLRAMDIPRLQFIDKVFDVPVFRSSGEQHDTEQETARTTNDHQNHEERKRNPGRIRAEGVTQATNTRAPEP